MNVKWKLFKIANGHLSCENLDLESTDIEEVEYIIENHFGAGILRRREILVSWDCWSGVFIMSSSLSEEGMSEGDEFVKEIYEFLNGSENNN